MNLRILGGSDSGNSSSDTNTSVPIVTSLPNPSGDELVARSSSSNIACSTTSISHVASGSHQTTEIGNNGRVSTGISKSSTGTSSVKESVASLTSGAITMSTSSAATVMSSTGLTTVVGDVGLSSKAASANTIVTGASVSGTSSGAIGPPTASSSTGSAIAPSSSSSYTDYRQIKRKLRSQAPDDVTTPSVGNNGQQGKMLLQIILM